MSEFLNTQKQLNKRTLSPQERQRNWKGFFPKNKECFPGIKRDYKNYYLVINELCQNYNMLHASKTRFCSVGNSQKRLSMYRKFFKKVCKHFKIDPRNLQPQHIEWYWTNYIKDWLKDKQSVNGLKKHMDDEISELKFFSRMIGKYGIVRNTPYYLRLVDPELNFSTPSKYRAQAMSEEKALEILEKAFKIDLLFGCQLLAMFAFGLRDKEACGLRPLEDFSDKDEGEGIRRYLTIREKAGSKGGRPRAIPFTNEFQYEAEQLLVTICKANNWLELRNPEKTLVQAVHKMAHQIFNSLKFRASTLGTTPYSFRHSYAQKFFAEALKEGLGQEESLKSTAIALGHYREGITGVYLNSLMRTGNESIGKILNDLQSTAPRSLDATKLIPLIVREMIFYDWKLGLELAILFADPKTNLGENPVIGMMFDLVLSDKELSSGQQLVDETARIFEVDPKDVEEVICCHGASIDMNEIFRMGVEPHLAKIVE